MSTQCYCTNHTGRDSQCMTELFEQFRQGDVDAFKQLYDFNADLLFNYGRKLTPDADLVKDAIHDIFVKLYHKRSELGAVSNFRSYVIISLKNRLLDELRKRSKMSVDSADGIAISASDCAEGRYLSRELHETESATLNKLLGVLSPRQRQAIMLYYIDKCQYEDICYTMSMNYQSVRNLIHRGMIKLRTEASQHSYALPY